MSDKYIIKNCPNLTTSHYGTGETIHNQCGLTDDDLCINCTDCVIKQVIEKCKNELGKVRTIGKDIMAEEILQLLDIQECEE